MTRFIITRHGQSIANLNFVFAGQSNFDLTEQGKAQAEKLAEWVVENYKIDKIYSSDLNRAYQTALPIAEALGLEITRDEALREINAGKWESQPYELIKKEYAADYGVWLNNVGCARCTDGESVKELSERVMKRILELGEAEAGKTVLISTHATPIRALQTLCETGDIKNAKDVAWVANASVSVCEYDKGTLKFTLCGYNEYLEDLKSKFPSGVV